MRAVRAPRRKRRHLRALMFLALAVAAVGMACRRDAPPAPMAPPAPTVDVAATPPEGAPAPPQAATTVPIRPAASAGTPAPPADGLLMPVQGIAPEQLHDTFTEARGTGRVHDAIDILAPAGTPVLAVADGTVEKLFDSERGGTTLYQFNTGRTRAYYYAHLQGYAPGITEHQPLRRGQLIGYVGSTGNASAEAPHLHFAVFDLALEQRWWEGTAVNPYPLLRGRR